MGIQTQIVNPALKQERCMYKRIGILGGMSPESTAEYYLYITRNYTDRVGDYSYPEIVIYSVSFQAYVDWPEKERWDLVATGLTQAARRLEDAGADFIVVATNTMHLVLDQVQAGVAIPILSLVEVVADAVEKRGMSTVGLLGTRFTMEKPLFGPVLARRGITVLTPGAAQRRYVNDVIYRELVAGRFRDESRQGFVSIVHELAGRGAQGVILGCTEIPLLMSEADAGLPLFNTTVIHAEAALAHALSG
jgi:aspartate racemase